MIRSALVGRTNPFSSSSSANFTSVPSRENIDRLLEMGFTEENAKAALTRTRNDLSSAIDMIMDDQLINPEARNDDFRMNSNNSNILANISTRNFPTVSENNVNNLNLTNTNENTVNNANSNNLNLNFSNNNNNISLTNNYTIEQVNQRINNSNRASETNANNTNNNNSNSILNLNANNSMNNTNNNSNARSVRFNLDMDNNDSESSGFRELIEPFEIDLPINSALNNRTDRSRFYREANSYSRFGSLQPRVSELYPRFDRPELNRRIFDPIDVLSNRSRETNNNNNNYPNNLNRINSSFSNNISRNANEISQDINMNNSVYSNALNLNEPILEVFDSNFDFNSVNAIDNINREDISRPTAIENRSNKNNNNNNMSNINTNDGNISKFRLKKIKLQLKNRFFY